MITATPPSIITIELIAKIKAQYRLKWSGIHGIKHWHRVYLNGMKLAQQQGANAKTIMIFSILHDSCRRSENKDEGHGKRGAKLAVKLREMIPLNDDDFYLMKLACEIHTSAKTHENITIQCCISSDRLDLPRVGITPDPERLCTPLAKMKKIIKWASYNSIHETELPENPFGINSQEA